MTSNTKTESTSNYTFMQYNIYPTHVVGAWVVDPQFRIALTQKPSWFHRLVMRGLLGWKYEPAIRTDAYGNPIPLDKRILHG